MKTVLIILHLIFCLALGTIVLMQSGKRSGLSGVIAGGMDTFMSKGKARTWDARLARITKWVALGFALLTLMLNLIPGA